jgi:hypothetical protein
MKPNKFANITIKALIFLSTLMQVLDASHGTCYYQYDSMSGNYCWFNNGNGGSWAYTFNGANSYSYLHFSSLGIMGNQLSYSNQGFRRRVISGENGNACCYGGNLHYGCTNYGIYWNVRVNIDGCITCANWIFGDPKPGYTKYCYCDYTDHGCQFSGSISGNNGNVIFEYPTSKSSMRLRIY